jgi:hypothetical protein
MKKEEGIFLNDSFAGKGFPYPKETVITLIFLNCLCAEKFARTQPKPGCARPKFACQGAVKIVNI